MSGSQARTVDIASTVLLQAEAETWSAPGETQTASRRWNSERDDPDTDTALAAAWRSRSHSSRWPHRAQEMQTKQEKTKPDILTPRHSTLIGTRNR